MAFDEYEKFDAIGLAALIAAREVSAEEVLEAAIARMEQRNPALKVLVESIYDEARRTIAAGLPEGPLSGVPFLMKELGLLMSGVRCNQGSRLFADFVADHDSTIVSRIRRAGLVVFGTTNSPEFGLSSAPQGGRSYWLLKMRLTGFLALGQAGQPVLSARPTRAKSTCSMSCQGFKTWALVGR